MVLFIALLAAAMPIATLAMNFPVTVGANNALSYTPTTVMAAVGDTITFTFVTKNHSITTTNFDGAVCPPPPGGVGVNGWDSGFMPVAAGLTPSFVYTVKDTIPHFAACMQAAGAHCRAGMTFALNPNAELTYPEFTANAEAS